MTQVVLQEDRLQIDARCVGMKPVRFGHNSCSRHRGGTSPSAAELTTRMHSRQRVAHHRLRVAIRQRSESPTLRAKSIASPVVSYILDLRVSPPGAATKARAAGYDRGGISLLQIAGTATRRQERRRVLPRATSTRVSTLPRYRRRWQNSSRPLAGARRSTRVSPSRPHLSGRSRRRFRRCASWATALRGTR